MKLILLDLDNTLIDGNCHLSVSEQAFRAVVQELANKDVCVGLCSDSAVITLRQWADRLGLTGPIVAERGAVVWDPKRKTESVIDTHGTSWFRELRVSFVSAAMRNFPGATIMVGDATRFVFVKDRRVNAALTPQTLAVNGFRVASFSFFACRPTNDQSALEADPDLLARASALAAEVAITYGKNKEDLLWGENAQYGILVVHARTTEKRQGVSALINQHTPDQIIMVGDGMPDFLDLPHVTQYAVGNADPRYKAKSEFVAERPLTEGVIECLRRCV